MGLGNCCFFSRYLFFQFLLKNNVLLNDRSKASFSTFHSIGIKQFTFSDCRDEHHLIGSVLRIQTEEFPLKTQAPIILLPAVRDKGCQPYKENAFKSSIFTYFSNNLHVVVISKLTFSSQFLNITCPFIASCYP